MLANTALTQYVNLCLRGCTQDTTLMQICKDSSPDRTNKSGCFENMDMSYFERMTPDCRIESFCTTGTQKKIDCFNADGFCGHCNTLFEAMGCFYQHCSCQEARTTLTEEYIERATKKRSLDEMRRQYIEEKTYTVVEQWECQKWKLYNSDV